MAQQTITEPRYVIGERDATGRYPVDVDGVSAGHIYRWHKRWYAAAPGRIETPHPDNDSAAEHLVKLIDADTVAKDPAARPQPPEAVALPRYVPQLSPRLKPTPGNILNAAKALARLQELAWEPVEDEADGGYPGADNPWLLRCLLCGWEGARWWSHLRGRNGDRTPRPKYRHDGCIPVAEIGGRVAALLKSADSCYCKAAHPTTADTSAKLLKSAARARRAKDVAGLTADLTRLLGPCPAATARAAAIEDAQAATKR